MAEDQGVNGDRWNDQLQKLLLALNWTTIGDSNMDLPNEKDSKHGVDRVYWYQDSHKKGNREAVIVEAKCYLTTSFSASLLDGWVKVLDGKLTKLKNSDELFKMFPILEQMPLRTGIIAVWFSDHTQYAAFQGKFVDAMKKVAMTRKTSDPNKIYVLENSAILRLASLCIEVEKINNSKNTKEEFKFFYPIVENFAANYSNVLNLNYFASKFVLGSFVGSDDKENLIVFYYGELNIESFERLHSALANVYYLNVEKKMSIYCYQRNDKEFRKIEPEIINLFGQQQVIIKEMENMTDLPTFMRNK